MVAKPYIHNNGLRRESQFRLVLPSSFYLQVTLPSSLGCSKETGYGPFPSSLPQPGEGGSFSCLTQGLNP